MVEGWQQRLVQSLVGLLLLLPAGSQAADEKQYDLKPVTADRLLKGTEDSSAWLMYGGDYNSWRYSALKDINKQNVKKLAVAWMFQTGIPGQLEASPVIADGILYLTTSYNHLYALDAVTGEPIWKYDHTLPDDMRVCCGPTNRGVAIADDKVFMATLDARLIALDRRTGKVAWNVEIDKYANGFSSTVAPLVVSRCLRCKDR
jgi:alcohol dehydrogenase (cytochrome c)